MLIIRVTFFVIYLSLNNKFSLMVYSIIVFPHWQR